MAEKRTDIARRAGSFYRLRQEVILCMGTCSRTAVRPRGASSRRYTCGRSHHEASWGCLGSFTRCPSVGPSRRRSSRGSALVNA